MNITGFSRWIEDQGLLQAEFKIKGVDTTSHDNGAIISRALLSLKQVADYLESSILSAESKSYLEKAMSCAPA